MLKILNMIINYSWIIRLLLMLLLLIIINIIIKITILITNIKLLTKLKVAKLIFIKIKMILFNN